MDQITTYATLQTAVIGILHREGDTDISSNVPLFIQLLEAELNDELLLRETEIDSPATLSTGLNYIGLPSGFISPIAFWLVIDTEREKLDQVLPQQLEYSPENSRPQYWAIDGATVRFDCPADQNYSAFLRCVVKSNLSVSNTSNALLLKRPDLYLYGTLKHAAIYTHDDANLVKWSNMYERAKKKLKDAENRSRAVPLRTDIPMAGGSGFDIYKGF